MTNILPSLLVNSNPDAVTGYLEIFSIFIHIRRQNEIIEYGKIGVLENRIIECGSLGW